MQVVLICTGNTWRSPMAEAILKHMLDSSEKGNNTTVISAAIRTHDGLPAAANAVQVLKERGLDLSKHKTQSLTSEIAQNADLILAMTNGHRSMILRTWPHLEFKTFVLRKDGGDVADPVGGSMGDYRKTAHEIEEELAKWAAELN